MDARPHVLQPAACLRSAPVMQLLHDHLPLTLLVDLVLGDHLDSGEVLAAERTGPRLPAPR